MKNRTNYSPFVQHLQRHPFVGVLTSLALARDHEAGGEVCQSNRAVRSVYVLTAGSRRAVVLPLQVTLRQVHGDLHKSVMVVASIS